MTSRNTHLFYGCCLALVYTTSAKYNVSEHMRVSKDTYNSVKVDTELYVINTEDNVSHQPTRIMTETRSETKGRLEDLPISTDAFDTEKSSPDSFPRANRRVLLDLISEKEELQKTLLSLNMVFPCGRIDRCRVGRNYCNTDTGRCEICNSDICHGTNADSMCNFMCKDFPPPEESSTEASPTPSSAIPTTPEVCPTVHDSGENNCQVWKGFDIFLAAVLALLIIMIITVLLWRKWKTKNNYQVENTSVMVPVETPTRNTHNENTSVMVPDETPTSQMVTHNAVNNPIQGRIPMMRQESTPGQTAVAVSGRLL